VVSVVEKPVRDSQSQEIIAMEGELNWMLELGANEKVSARPRVFNQVAYFATFTPDATNDDCALGKARVYGIDYQGDDPAQRQKIDVITNADVFVPRLPADPTDASNAGFVSYWEAGSVAESVLPSNSVVYSLDITRPISCYQTTVVDDPFGGSTVRFGGISDTTWALDIGATSQTSTTTAGQPSQAATQSQITLNARNNLQALPTSWGVVIE
jgi:hypothetical protein